MICKICRPNSFHSENLAKKTLLSISWLYLFLVLFFQHVLFFTLISLLQLISSCKESELKVILTSDTIILLIVCRRCCVYKQIPSHFCIFKMNTKICSAIIKCFAICIRFRYIYLIRKGLNSRSINLCFFLRYRQIDDAKQKKSDFLFISWWIFFKMVFNLNLQKSKKLLKFSVTATNCSHIENRSLISLVFFKKKEWISFSYVRCQPQDIINIKINREKKFRPGFFCSLHGLRKVESIMHTCCWNLLLKLVAERFWTYSQS